MPSRSRVDPPGVFASLADIVRQGSTPKEMYAAICVAATLTVPGCDHASLMICHDGVFSTAAVSDAIAREIDKLELALRSGPCLDAIEECTAQIQSDLTAGSRWPALTARVVAETPVRGAMSIQLPVDRAKSGALNLFSDTPKCFRQHIDRACARLGGVRDACYQCRGARRRRGRTATRARQQSRDRQGRRHADGAQ